MTPQQTNPKITKKNNENWKNLKNKSEEYFKKFTGHDIRCISSFDEFSKFLHTSVDASALGIGRMLFGAMMLLDIPDERAGSELDTRWGEPKDCRFPLITWLEPMSLSRMGILYAVMWLGALGITLGYKFKITCTMFVIPYWYIFLLDKSSWNNHSYLFGLIGTLFLTTDAHKYCSIDALQNPSLKPEIPFWNYFIIKFQFFILYFLAGIKKMCSEWLSGYAMSNLSNHWVFSPFRLFLSVELADLLIIHWFGCFFDVTVFFFLVYKPTRPIATFFSIAFHFMNSRLFSIGMFPWVCLMELPLFYSKSWPKKFMKIKEVKKKVKVSKENKKSFKQKIVTSLILFYCSLQLFLPYSHFLTKGYNNWTNGLYGYSWDMMVHAWDTILVSVKVVDNGNGDIHFLDPYAYTQMDRWTKHADMALQYSKCVERNLQEDFQNNPKSILKSSNISIYLDVWCSLNGRFQQRIYNPNVDILKADWSPFQDVSWNMPLLKEFTYLRPKMNKLVKDVLSWSNYTDVLFIADFPGLFMENYISTQLTNISLTVLNGAIKYELEGSPNIYSLATGQSLNVEVGTFHRIYTVSKGPSSYMYTYLNKTMQDQNLNYGNSGDGVPDVKPNFPIWTEIMKRIEKYSKFSVHIFNSLICEIFGVPMPRRLNEYS